MIRFIITCGILLISLGGVQAQIEHERFNPLPPGPARISGSVLLDGETVENAIVRLECVLDDEHQQRDFKTFGHGEYTVYINEQCTAVVIKVIVDGETLARFEPDHYSQGSVQRKNFSLPAE